MARKRKYPLRIEKLICKEYKIPTSVVLLANKYNMSPSGIYKILSKYKVKRIYTPRKRKYTSEIEKIICKEYNRKSSPKLGDKYNLDYGTILNILKRNNVEIKQPGVQEVYKCNKNYFSKMDVPEKAYWVGFIAADGHLNKKYKYLRIVLARKDKTHLRKLKISLNSNHRLYYVSRLKAYGLVFYSRNLFNNLLNLKNKGYFENMPGHLKKYFILGLFDGDGSIYYGKKARSLGFSMICNDVKELNNIQKHLMDKCNLNKTKIEERKDCCYIKYCGNLQVPRIMDYLYKNAPVYLDRKYKKYQKLLKQIHN